ncbi:DgyrCDS14770 [Dimorphilus gyrociliatus]|uniref:DgyrCDS14770 n=1 Tax=Dimorphilus gyrociliatus TaxID=2664684 RepID=A0A7I8WEU7_9ANNE|nr:DgyrCDS14770 [Dimorphilus gyrociliatus]
MKSLHFLSILCLVLSLERFQCQVVINELDLNLNYIELRNLNSAPFTFDGQSVKLASYSPGPTYESSAILTGSIAGNGIVKYDINGAKKRRKRSPGGSIALNIGTDASRYILIYKQGESVNWDSLVFKTSESASGTVFTANANEWDNKYLLYSPGKVFVRIADSSDSPESWEIRDVGTPDAPNGANGDPHFMQTILDRRTNKTEKVCYDVTGKSGNKIFILEDKLTSTKVFGILLNDYYMHSIEIVQKQLIIFNIKTNEIIFKNGKQIIWESANHLEEYGKFFHISIIQNNVFLNIKNTIGNRLNVKISRRETDLTGKYLDISFDNITPTNDRYYGIIGHVGHQPIAFMDLIQEDDKTTVVKMNNSLFNAKKLTRYENECWLIKFEDLIAPKVPQDFVN